jgi:hypothetical protein
LKNPVNFVVFYFQQSSGFSHATFNGESGSNRFRRFDTLSTFRVLCASQFKSPKSGVLSLESNLIDRVTTASGNLDPDPWPLIPDPFFPRGTSQ